jgi:hypothetical protein
VLRSQTLDASSHTNYLFRFLKNGHGAEPRQTANYAAFLLLVNRPERVYSLVFVTRPNRDDLGSSKKGAQYSRGNQAVNW